MNIDLYKPDIRKEDHDAVLKVLKNEILCFGPDLIEFENKLAKYIGQKYAVAVNSGTSALHLAVKALGIQEDDEVITTPFSFIASSNCILFEKAKPVFIDIDPRTRNIDPEKIEAKITKKTKLILVVDIFGQSAHWQPILKIAKKHNLKIIEDSCQALGSVYKRKKCGTFGNISVFSFSPNKPVTGTEGGIVLTDNKRIYDFCLSLRNQGREDYTRWLDFVRLGYSYRLGEMNCALALSHFNRLEKTIKKRQEIVKKYNKYLSKINGIIVPFVADYATKINWMHYVPQLDKKYTRKDRDEILAKLNKEGIGCRDYFPPIHLMPFYKKMFGYKKGDYPVCESISERVIALPLHHKIIEKQIIYISKILKKIL